ncbi:MAG: toll/interleukin-1 receptor domain-containing protein [Acidobacteriaceae bacterium]
MRSRPLSKGLPGRGLLVRSVFVSYRRKDSEGESGRLFDDLTSHFGSESVFMDVSAIEPGRDFRKAIDQSVTTCSVLLAIIGQEWLELKDAGGRRRLEDPNDFVRLELASALRRDIPVIPVLVRGAKMPEMDRLPPDLQELAYRNAVELTHARWKSDVQLLIRALRPYLDVHPDAPRRGEEAGQRSNASPPAERPTTPVPLSRVDTAVAVPFSQPDALERICRELSSYIGPVAEVIVKRAARKCSTAEDLIKAVAREIEDETERARFLRASRA